MSKYGKGQGNYRDIIINEIAETNRLLRIYLNFKGIEVKDEAN